MKSKTIYIPEIGDILFQKTRRNKKIILSIKPPGKVRVSLPDRGSFKQAEQFVISKTDWIKENIEKVKNIKQPKEIVDLAALKLKANAYLPQRAEYLSQKTGLKYKKLTIFKSKRCWGMCMGDNSIKLNMHLMRLPNEFIDYVILHELAHIKEKNHSSRFYEFLGTLIDEPKKWAKNMKKYSLTHYLPSP